MARSTHAQYTESDLDVIFEKVLTEEERLEEVIKHVFYLIDNALFTWAEPMIKHYAGKIDCNTRDKFGETLLCAAVKVGNARAVKLLLEISAHPDLNRTGRWTASNTPAHVAVRDPPGIDWKDSLEILEVFRASGLRINMNKPNGYGEYVLDNFADRGSPEYLPVLLKCMQMGAWRYTDFVYTLNDYPYWDEIKTRTVNIISSRRTCLVLKMRPNARPARQMVTRRKAKTYKPRTMRTRIPKELWMRLIQMLSQY